MFLMFWWPSGREITIRESEFAPAFFGMPSATLTTGSNGRGSGGQPVVVTDGVLSLTRKRVAGRNRGRGP